MLRGRALLERPLLNRGTAFTEEERKGLGLVGLLPSAVLTLEQQAKRAYQQYQDQPTDLNKNIYLTSLQDRNEVLFYKVREKGLEEFALIDHGGAAEQAGLKMQEAKLLVFGSPRAGTPLMVASPLLALDLPLKVLVWRYRDGEVLMSYNATSYLARRHNVPEDLIGNIAGIDALVEGMLGEL